MTKTTKILLAISLTSFALSVTGVLWGLFLPVGAITFGLFMIFNLLGKETALFDEEQHLRRLEAEENASATSGSSKIGSSKIVTTRAVRAAAYH